MPNPNLQAGPGRNSLYKPEYDEQAYKLCLLGADDEDLADFFEVCEATINNWKQKHQSFLESLKRGKVIADAEVAESTHNRAKGYDTEEVIVNYDKDGNEIGRTVKTRHVPSDTKASELWLRNRQPKNWSGPQKIEHSGNISNLPDERLVSRFAEITGQELEEE